MPSLFLAPLVFALLKVWCDLGARINLLRLSIYKKLALGSPKLTAMLLLMDDIIVKRPIGVLQDIHVKVELFIFPTNFVILDCEVNMEKGKMKFWLMVKRYVLISVGP